MKSKQKIPESKHFLLESLAEGVYAAISREGGWAINNAGLVDLGDRVLVFDTLMTPQAGNDLRQAAEALAGANEITVINSHYHNDHIWGNQAFLPDADIIASIETRDLISSKGIEEYRWYKENAGPRLKALEAQYRAEKDEGMRSKLFQQISYYEGMVKAFPRLDVVLPTLTFGKELELHGSERQARLIALGGHTLSDAVLYLPEERIIFMSDLLFIHCHPYLGDGNLARWRQSLETASQLDAHTYIPGHGPAGTKKDIQAMQHYMDRVETLASKAYTAGKSEAALEKTTIPKAYVDWEMPEFFYTNLRFLYQQTAQSMLAM